MILSGTNSIKILSMTVSVKSSRKQKLYVSEMNKLTPYPVVCRQDLATKLYVSEMNKLTPYRYYADKI